MIIAVGSTPWLLIHELRLARRGMLARPGMKWRAPLVLVAFLIGGLAAGVPAALALKRFGLPHTVMVAAIAAVACLAVATLMLSQSLAAATETLYARSDLDLLFSSPIAPRRVVFAKCSGIAVNAFISFALLVTPVVLPVAILADPRWLAVYGVLAALALLATSAGLAIAIGLFRLIGPKRTRTVSQLLAVFIGASLFLAAQSRNLIGSARFNHWTNTFAEPGVAKAVVDGPLSWPLRALTGEPAFLVTVIVLACMSFAGATAWVGRRFASDTAAASGAAVGKTSRRGGDGAFAAGVFGVTVRKELRLLRRDIPLLAQVLLRVVYLLPLIFILLRSAGGHGAMRLPVGVGAVAFMCGQVAGSLVWLTVSAEDAPELIGCAPASAAAIRRGKLCAALCPLAGLMTIPLAILIALSPLAGVAAATGCVAAALSSALIGFALQKPAKRSAFGRRGAGSLVATLAEFGAGAVVALVSGFAVVWPPLILVLLGAVALLGWCFGAARGRRSTHFPRPTPSFSKPGFAFWSPTLPRRPLSSHRSNPAARMMMLRQWHTYVGAFIAPSVLFFALTGALQLFSLHEAHDGYKPPALIEKLASVHKDQVFRAKEDHHDHAATGHDEDGDHHDADHARSDHAGASKGKPADAAQIRIWMLKWVFAVVALGLVVSTLIGLWLALTTGKRRGVALLVLLVGAVIPILLLAL